ncbi:hypothetical protein BH23VER1_BH23VER1_33300 [soil metagenome]
MDAGCYGTADIRTPHLDALAARGTRFTQFYAASAVCSASRAGLLTGRYPARAGLDGNASSRPGGRGLPAGQETMAELFGAAGYATAHIGKWHLGYTPDEMPNAQGFDHSFGHMGGCIDNYSHFFYWDGPNRHDLHRNGEEIHLPGRFFPELMVEEARTFITAHRADPFFLYFALNLPHYPYQGDPGWLAHYQEAGVPYPRDLYNAFVSTLDEHIGQLLAVLDDLGLRQDTIVVFQSDHGHSTEERAHGGGGSAGPYRGAKFSLFEGGIRVPAVISWPGHLPEGQTSDALAHGCDWFPTLAALAGIDTADRDIDGRDLGATIRDGAPSPHADRPLHWKLGNQWAVRSGQWKLIGNPRDSSADPSAYPEPGDLFLSNLADNPAETRDFAPDHPEVVQRLQDLHRASQ